MSDAAAAASTADFREVPVISLPPPWNTRAWFRSPVTGDGETRRRRLTARDDAGLRLHPLLGRRRRPAVDDAFSCALGAQAVADGVGIHPWNEHEYDRAVRAGGPRVVLDGVQGGGPAIADPDGDLTNRRRRERIPEMESDLPRHLRLAVLEGRLSDLVADRGSNDTASAVGLPDVIVPETRCFVLEGLQPFGGDRRLQDVLTVDVEQDPLRGHLGNGLRNATPDIRAARDEVIDQEVRQGVDRRANASRERPRLLEPRDQKRELRNPGLQRIIFESGDQGRGISGQNAGLLEIGEDRVVHRVRSDDGSNWGARDFLGRLEDDPQLGPELAGLAGAVHRSEDRLPEPAPRGQ